MKPPKRILFPLDFSEHAVSIVPYVREMAQRFTAQITVLHSFDAIRDYNLAPVLAATHESVHTPIPYTPAFQKLRDERQRRLEEFAAEQLAGTNYVVRIEDGDPALVIESVARDESADLLMMPTKGLGKFRSMLLGSITAKVLHDVSCPVFTSAHEPQVPAVQKGGYASLLCALELDPEGEVVLKAAAFLARTYGAKLYVVHVAPKGAGQSREESSAESLRHKLERALETDGGLGLETKITILDAAIPRGVRSAALDEKADLVVVGRGHAQGTLSRVWSNLYGIIRESPCPVWSV